MGITQSFIFNLNMNINNRLRRKIRVGLLYGLGLACLAMILLCQPHPSYSLTPSEVPNPRQVYGGWVTDMANILSDDTETQLNQMISELEATNGAEIAIVTVPETQPSSSPKAFTTELFNTWGIGKAGDDNGILFLTSVGDRRVEIETGYGMEGILPDAQVGLIIDSKIKPHFKTGDFDRGTLAGTEALIKSVQSEVFESGVRPPEKIPNLLWFLIGSAGLLSYGFYDLAGRSVRQPILVNPGDYRRINGWDRDEIAPHLWLGFAVFLVLLSLTTPALFLMLKIAPKFALIFGVFVVAIPFLCCRSYPRTCKVKKSREDIDIETKVFRFLMVFVLTALCLPLIIFSAIALLWILPRSDLIWEVVAVLLLATIVIDFFGDSRRAIAGVFFATFFSVILATFWAASRADTEGYIPFVLEVSAANFGQFNTAIFTATILSFFGGLPIARKLSRSRLKTAPEVRSLRPVHSAISNHPLQPLDRDTLTSLLTEHERIAQELETVSFEGWWSPELGELSRETIYLKAYVENSVNGYYQCPVGEELTVTRTSTTVKAPTQSSTGIRRITFSCHCCDYQKESEQIIPRLSSASSSVGYGGSGCGGASSGGGGGGGGGFGGGSSGGGGAGGSF